MTLDDWLNEEEGRATALASAMGVTKAAVTHWRTRGAPLIKHKAISAFTKGRVKTSDLMQTIFDHKTALAERKVTAE